MQRVDGLHICATAHLIPSAGNASIVQPFRTGVAARFLTTKELSKLLGIPEGTLRQWRCAEVGPKGHKLREAFVMIKATWRIFSTRASIFRLCGHTWRNTVSAPGTGTTAGCDQPAQPAKKFGQVLETHRREQTAGTYKCLRDWEEMVDAVGIEPTTSRLRVECSTN
jgi:hypothetical protein